MHKFLKKQIIKDLNHVTKGKIINLANEKLSVTDYQWLAQKIKKSGVVETIILPQIPAKDIELVLSILNEITIKHSTLANIEFSNDKFVAQLAASAKTLYQQIQSRLQRNKAKIFGIHGGGPIGLGLMDQVVSGSPRGYQVIATSSNQLNKELINSVNKLWLQHGASADSKTTCVKNVTMISREKEDIIKLYKEASMVAICLKSNVLDEVARDIAEALIERDKLDGSGLKVLVLMNVPDCASFTRDKIFAALEELTSDEAYAEKVLSKVEFVPTVIDRVVTPIESAVVLDHIKSQLVEKIDQQTLEETMRSPIALSKAVKEFGLEFRLFNAESKFMMYVPDTFCEARVFPDMRVTDNLAKIEILKNKYFNGPHAVLAWVGGLFGCTTIAEAISRPNIRNYIREMMEQEIRPILAEEHPEITDAEFDAVRDSFFERCEQNKDDTVYRVGRDPLRKLNSGARIRGTIELAEKLNLDVPTTKLEEAIAAGVLYAIKEINPDDAECQRMLQIYKENNNSFAAILCHKSDDPSDTFKGFSAYEDRERVNEILSVISKVDDYLRGKERAKASSIARHYQRHDVWQERPRAVVLPVSQHHTRTPTLRKQQEGAKYV